MTKYSFFCLPLVLLANCSSDTVTKPTASTAPIDQKKKALDQLRIQFASANLIDSSDYVMYPLPINEVVTEESDSYIYGKSSGRSETYWNIIFLNTKNGTTRLLSKNQKMVIQTFSGSQINEPTASNSKNSHSLPTENLFYYRAITQDFNNDGELTMDDPTYLFTSDRNGENFQQVSPNDLHVLNWEVNKFTNKILLQTSSDSNHNLRFDSEDEIIPYIYDVSTKNPATRVFSSEYVTKLKLEFQAHWAKQPK